MLLATNLIGHFVDGVSSGQTHFMTNVKQVSKMLPAFDTTAILDQVAQYRRLPDIVLKSEAVFFHGVDDADKPSLKEPPVLNTAAPEQVNGEPVSTDQVIGIVLCLKQQKLIHGQPAIESIPFIPISWVRYQWLGMAILLHCSLVETITSKQVSLPPARIEKPELALLQPADGSGVIIGQKIPLGQLNGTHFTMVIAQGPPLVMGYAVGLQFFPNLLPGRFMDFTTQTMEC